MKNMITVNEALELIEQGEAALLKLRREVEGLRLHYGDGAARIVEDACDEGFRHLTAMCRAVMKQVEDAR